MFVNPMSQNWTHSAGSSTDEMAVINLDEGPAFNATSSDPTVSLAGATMDQEYDTDSRLEGDWHSSASQVVADELYEAMEDDRGNPRPPQPLTVSGPSVGGAGTEDYMAMEHSIVGEFYASMDTPGEVESQDLYEDMSTHAVTMTGVAGPQPVASLGADPVTPVAETWGFYENTASPSMRRQFTTPADAAATAQMSVVPTFDLSHDIYDVIS